MAKREREVAEALDRLGIEEAPMYFLRIPEADMPSEQTAELLISAEK
ncbi:hypothetical protein [Aureimonas altamirensis]|nr:hypothetical protein [Aureimonas altamirensis]